MAKHAYSKRLRYGFVAALLGGLVATYICLVVSSVIGMVFVRRFDQQFANDFIWPISQITIIVTAALFVGCVIGAIVRRHHNP